MRVRHFIDGQTSEKNKLLSVIYGRTPLGSPEGRSLYSDMLPGAGERCPKKWCRCRISSPVVLTKGVRHDKIIVFINEFQQYGEMEFVKNDKHDKEERK